MSDVVQIRNDDLVALLQADFPPRGKHVNLQYVWSWGDGSTDLNVWRIGDVALDLDFTGTLFDTKVECNAVGLRFSDTDVPFPDTLTGPTTNVTSTWTHVAGKGWQPAETVNDGRGPAILVPIMRPANWELSIDIGLQDAAGADEFRFDLGYITNSNHVGAIARVWDADGVNISYLAILYTNDGDNTFTARYTGIALLGAATRTVKFRCFSGTVGVWDDQVNAWRPGVGIGGYEGRQTTVTPVGINWTAAHAYVQFIRTNGTDPTLYVSALKLTYLQ